MPAPDPEGLWIERTPTGRRAFYYRYFWTGKDGNRKARAGAILRRLAAGSWRCRECGDLLPDHKRADARYCCEGCRKAAARRRRGRLNNQWKQGSDR